MENCAIIKHTNNFYIKMQSQYSPEQQADIIKRMDEGTKALEAIGLRVAVQIVPYLQDTIYTNSDGTLKMIEEAPTPDVIPAPEEIAPIPSDNAEVNPSL